jgi:sugar phosphate isomerase/epimerase
MRMVTMVKQIGNSKIIVHSPSGVIAMTPEQRREWFARQWEEGNPVVRRIVEVALDIESKAAAREGA